MADAYATLASGGIHHDPTAVSRVEFPDGEVDEADADSGERVLTEGQAYEVTKMLEGVITQGTGAGYTYMGCCSEAGKTGTSEGVSDAWFAGYTPLYSTAVWVGHPQSREYTGFGGPTAGPIWRSSWNPPRPATAPNSTIRAACPNSPACTANTRAPRRNRARRPKRTKKRKKKKRARRKKKRKKKEAKKGAEAKPEPAPNPQPARIRRPRRARPAPPAPASAAASPRRR